MKKIISTLIICAIVTTTLFAFDFSIGVGRLFEESFRNGSWIEGSITYPVGEDEFRTIDTKVYEGFRKSSNGFFVFFDTKYAVLDVSYASSYVSAVWEGVPMVFGLFPTEDGKVLAGKMEHLNFSLLGKYPIDMGLFNVFPLLGVNYNYVFGFDDIWGNEYLKDVKEHETADLSQFGILGGLGADYNLTDTLFLRGQALFNLRFPSKMANDAADQVEKNTEWSANNTLGTAYKLSLGIGYRF